MISLCPILLDLFLSFLVQTEGKLPYRIDPQFVFPSLYFSLQLGYVGRFAGFGAFRDVRG